MTTVKIVSQNVYGVDKFYPFNDEAHELTRLTGTKTFSQYHLNTIKRLGFGLELVASNGVVIEVMA